MKLKFEVDDLYWSVPLATFIGFVIGYIAGFDAGIGMP